MRGLPHPIRLLSVIVLVALLPACAHTGAREGEEGNTDRFERYNRAMFKFNDKLDRAVLKPVATGYKKIFPSPIRRGVGNFFNNLREPTTIVNDLLQGKLDQAVRDFLRFGLNTTFGFLGWVDIASHGGLERHQEDFGQTFAVWGLGPGPYLVLPVIGPSTVADGIGFIPQALYTDPRTVAVDSTEEALVLIGIDVIDIRARLLGASKLVDLQLDPYIFTRETYLQQRRQLIYDGNPPLEEELQ
jgi:phospholipid-binding lipoprotein MlaA